MPSNADRDVDKRKPFCKQESIEVVSAGTESTLTHFFSTLANFSCEVRLLDEMCGYHSFGNH